MARIIPVTIFATVQEAEPDDDRVAVEIIARVGGEDVVLHHHEDDGYFSDTDVVAHALADLGQTLAWARVRGV
jgi:hypothetical protein